MENYTRTERAHYNEYRARVCHRLDITTAQYNRLRRYSQQLTKFDTARCNGEFEGKEVTGTNIDADKLYVIYCDREWRKVKQYLENQGIVPSMLHFYHQSDPRGCALYVDTVAIPEDNYNQACAIY